MLLLAIEETQDASKKELHILHTLVLFLVGIKFRPLCMLSTVSIYFLKNNLFLFLCIVVLPAYMSV